MPIVFSSSITVSACRNQTKVSENILGVSDGNREHRLIVLSLERIPYNYIFAHIVICGQHETHYENGNICTCHTYVATIAMSALKAPLHPGQNISILHTVS